jgi:hypothetical protein
MVYFSKSNLWLLHILIEHLGDYKLSGILLKNSTDKDLVIIFELAKNILVGNIPISKSQKDQLKKYESKLVFLSEPNKKVKDKVNILINSKSFLEHLLLIGEEFLLNNNYNSESEEEEDEQSE